VPNNGVGMNAMYRGPGPIRGVPHPAPHIRAKSEIMGEINHNGLN